MTIRGTTRIAAVLGWPVTHSRSPQMLNAAFAAAGVDAVMVPIGVSPDGFAAVLAGLRAANALGASVTVPHKLAALAACDEATDAARAIGAVNCLELRDGRVIGHNTDAPGFADALVAAGFTIAQPRVVLLGAGGAARAVAHGVAGAAIEVIARRPGEVAWARASAWTPESLRAAFATADLVVDCTSAALGPDEVPLVDQLPFDALPSRAWVASLVYHRRTILLERAAAHGHSTVDGRGMLVHQGARAFAIWTGRPAPIDIMTRALDASLGSGT